MNPPGQSSVPLQIISGNLKVLPESSSKQRLSKSPENNCRPAIANIRNTKIMITIISTKLGIALTIVIIRVFSFLIEEIVRKGRSTR